jgi:hypothetical protein
MTLKNLRKIKRKIATLRAGSANIRPQKLIRVARSLSRKLSNRGKEPIYLSELLPHKKLITIPSHSGSLPRFTAENILDDLDEDVDELIEIEETRKQGGSYERENGKRLS